MRVDRNEMECNSDRKQSSAHAPDPGESLKLVSERPEKEAEDRVSEIMKSTLAIDRPEIVSETSHVTKTRAGLDRHVS